MCTIKICISVTSHALDPIPPRHKQTVTPSRTLSPLERDVLYGRPLTSVTCMNDKPEDVAKAVCKHCLSPNPSAYNT